MPHLDRPASHRRLPWAALEDVTAGLFRKRGLEAADARVVADHLVRAEARGIHAHGLLRLGFYLGKLDAGSMSPVTSLSTVGGVPALPLLSANNGVGQVVATRAMERVMGAAGEHGVGAVLVRHSNPLGAAQLFTLKAAEAGLIGIVLTNAGPAMAPAGGAEKRIGTDAWSVAAPVAGADPLVMDMASHEGYAIALAVELLTGILGGGWLDDMRDPGHADRTGNVTHLFAAIDPEQVGGPGYAARVLNAARRLEAVRRARGRDVLPPGEREARREREAREAGVPLAPEVVAALEGYAIDARILYPWASAPDAAPDGPQR